MRKVLLVSFLTCLLPNLALADSKNYEFKFDGVSRVYYGVMDTNKKAIGTNNMPNRKVSRTDTKFKANYDFQNGYKLTYSNDSVMIFKEHDTAYRNGEWRFFNYANLDSPYGQLTGGQTYNVAKQFHKGAQDVGPLKIEDSNITYFLSNPNWKKGRSAVAFYTPKSTAMINDGRALKLNYITPKYKDTLLGFTYTPNNEDRMGMVSRYSKYEKTKDAYVFAIHNEQETKFADIYTSAGYGIFNRTDKELSLGLTVVRGGFSYALGYKNAYVDGKDNPISVSKIDSHSPAFYDNYRESEAFDASIGYEIGAYKTSVAYLHTRAKNTDNKDDVFLYSNTYDYNKWLDIYLIGAYLNSKGVDYSDNNKNKGYAVVGGIGLKF